MLKKIADRLVEQLGVDESEVTPEASFKDDLAADSIDLFEMVMSLEDEYDIEIPTDKLEEIDTVGDLMEVLEELGIEEEGSSASRTPSQKHNQWRYFRS